MKSTQKESIPTRQARALKHRSFWLLLVVALSLVIISCGKALSNDVLYGVWLGKQADSSRILVTFIAKGKAEVELPDAKPSKKITGTWEIKEGMAVLTVEGLPELSFSLDSVSENGDKHDRLTDNKHGVSVTKV